MQLHLAVGLAEGGGGGLGGGHASGHEGVCHAGHVEAKGDGVGDNVGSEGLLVGLGGAGDEGGEERGAGAAADVAGEVGEGGDLVGFFERHADVVEGADGNEDEGQRHHLEDAPLGDGAEGGVEIEPGEVVDAEGGAEVSGGGHGARIDLADGAAGDEHHEHEGETGGGEHHAGAFGGVAEQGLQVLRDEDGGAEEHHAEDELEEDGGAEVSVLEELDVDDGVGVVPLPEDEPDEENDGGDEGDADADVGEPVFLLALVEGVFEQAYADGDEAEAGEVDLEVLGGLFAGDEVGRVFDDAVGEIEREQADGKVDEEDPVPVEVVGDPAAEGGADGGREDDGHAVDGEGLPAPLDGEGVGEDGLLAGGEAASAEALQDAGEDKDRQRGREAAEQGADGEHEHAGHVEALAAEAVGEPSGDGKDDGGGYEIGGEDPRGFVLTCAEGARDVGKGYVGDGGVEDLHESGKGDRQGDGPGVVPGLPCCCELRGAPGGRESRSYGCSGHISLLI